MANPLIRNVDDAPMAPMTIPGAEGVAMSVMVGRADGAPNFAMRQVHVGPGGHSPHHSHDYEHEVYVVGGRGTVTLFGREHPIRAGDVVYVPAQEEHQFRAGTDNPEGLRFLCLVPVTRNCGDATPGS